jgi:hypothetical protein
MCNIPERTLSSIDQQTSYLSPLKQIKDFTKLTTWTNVQRLWGSGEEVVFNKEQVIVSFSFKTIILMGGGVKQKEQDVLFFKFCFCFQNKHIGGGEAKNKTYVISFY